LSTHGIQHAFSGDPLTGREVDDGAVGEGLDFLWKKEGGREGGREGEGGWERSSRKIWRKKGKKERGSKRGEKTNAGERDIEE